MKKLVSIVTPYHTGDDFVQMFHAVINQTFSWFEWIIVYDEEKSLQILQNLIASDKRIILLRQEKSGICQAFCQGIQNAETEWIVPLDSQNIVAPQYLEYLYWALYFQPEASWAYSNYYETADKKSIWKQPWSIKKLTKENVLPMTAMIRKKDYEEVGGYKPDISLDAAIRLFWLEMLGRGKKPIHIATPLYWNLQDRSSTVELYERRQIRKAADKVDKNIKAIEYPCIQTEYTFYRPKFRKWKETVALKESGKRILWLLPWMVMGGADKFNLDAVAGLKKKGYENCILTTLASENDWRERFEEFTDEIFCMPDFLDPVHYIEFVAYYIQSRQIDVLLVTNSYDGYYMLPWLRQHFPELVIIDYVHMEEWYWREGGHARVSGALSGISEKTYVCNSATRQVMIKHFGCHPERVECMYIGVDDKYFCEDKEDAGYLKKKLSLDPQCQIVLFPCRIHEQKRPFMVLPIASEVCRRIPNTVFVIVGDGPQLKELKKAIKRQGLSDCVYCIGRCTEMRACYRDSDLTLICSLKEGLSLTAYESCAMGVPIISADVGGQKDLIGSDVGALIPLMQDESRDLDNRKFPEAEIKQYVECITRLLEQTELRIQLGKNARKKIEEKFSQEKMVDHLSHEIEMLSSDPVHKNERIKLSNDLSNMNEYSSEFYSLYCQWQKQEHEMQRMGIIGRFGKYCLDFVRSFIENH